MATTITADLIGTGFNGAVSASSAPGDPDHLYVIKKNSGEIFRFDPATGAATLFMDIDDFAGGGERGVLGIAFHPQYASNGRFFIFVTALDGDVEIREYQRVAGDPPTGDVATKNVLLSIEHSSSGNHNGGSIHFAPNGEPFLYISVGDGGSSSATAQNTNVLLGKILRIDVDSDAFPADPARDYAIPAGNPFAGGGGAPEIWDFGLRNPWRVTFDSATGDMYIADVGERSREEIDFHPASSSGGLNFGWDQAEGTLGNPPPGAIPPIFEYGRDLGNVVTGGYVYRGPGDEFVGHYFLTDFGSDRLWTLKVVNGQATEVTDRTDQLVSPEATFGLISSFGVDGAGRLYAVSLSGNIFRLDFPAQNDTPSATNLTQSKVYAQGAANVALDDIVASDPDTADMITATLTLANPATGALTTSGAATYNPGTGVWTITGAVVGVNAALAAVAFVPAADNDLDTTITTHIRDAADTGPADGTITLDVTPLNDAPLSGVTIIGTDGADLVDATHTVAGQPLPTVFGDVIRGKEGKDDLSGLAGDDTIGGGKGGDVLGGDAGDDRLLGRTGKDSIAGGEGDDLVDGGRAKDILTGGDGLDTFTFANPTKPDQVTDFVEGDLIALSKNAFPGIGPEGNLKAKYFHVGDQAETTKQKILYDDDSGWLLYAKHGAATVDPVAFARIGKNLSDFDNADIIVI